MQPFGGSEIQLAYLRKYVSKELLSKIKLELSVPERSPVVVDKTNVLWIQNSYDQPNLHPWFKNKLNHGKYDWYVFNSHWVHEKYRYFFDIPTEQSMVIKNGRLMKGHSGLKPKGAIHEKTEMWHKLGEFIVTEGAHRAIVS